MKIPPEIIDRIRSGTDIVSLIGEQVRLTKAGRSWKGLCPFHIEKTPSFMINPERQTYHCFGCGAGGNVFTFMIEFAGMSFPEAARHLAERQGIPIPRSGGPSVPEQETARLLEALAFAAGFYQERLSHPYAGKPGRDYLAGRDISPEQAAAFGLGFAPAAWRHLVEAAGRRFAPDLLTRAGLVILREDGSAYDRFRNRIMIPVMNGVGKVVGFGGRVIEGEEPKYINSPESAVYQKGQILFGLTQAREALHREDVAIVVEGYLDHMRVFGAGFQNVVAAAGTAFTPQQASLLKRFVRRAVLVFDGDRAGLSASWRAVGPCLASGLDAGLAILPPGHDPDSLIRDEGIPAFRKVVAGALDPIEFAATHIVRTAGREEALRRLVTVIREVGDPLRRRLLIQAAADRLAFDEATLVRVVESEKGGVSGALDDRARASLPPGGDPVERDLVAILLAEPGVGEALPDLSEDDFQDPLCREIFQRVMAGPSGRFSADRLMEEESGTPLARLVSRLLVESVGGGVRAASDMARALRVRAANRRISELRSELKHAEESGDVERSRNIRMRITELKKSTLLTGAET